MKLYHTQIKYLHSDHCLCHFDLDSELVTLVAWKYPRIMNSHFNLGINENMMILWSAFKDS